jgi:hypothetical protein
MKLQAFNLVYTATMSLLPASWTNAESKAMLYAMGMQESRFEHRRQIMGPARGFWQFEAQGGIRGVLEHPMTKTPIRAVCDALCYDYSVLTAYQAIEHNDILACAFARCLLYTLPQRLPNRDETQEGWNQYLAAWRPGKPHAQTWPVFYRQAWEIV